MLIEDDVKTTEAWLDGVEDAIAGIRSGDGAETSLPNIDAWVPMQGGFQRQLKYRAKPQPQPQPKYRPFTRREVENHETAIIRHEYDIGGDVMRLIAGTHLYGAWIENVGKSYFKVTFTELLARYTFENGTPCGVLVEGEIHV